ncbi:MAG: hypothetical protein KF900_05135 [Bacteroidetes bacterium]|nr:hypothetical protein [Bacteroidota bacterium]
MCDYRILAHNAHGYVIMCNSCRSYQLAFGTTAATFEPAEYKRFCKEVEETLNEDFNDGFEAHKRISLDLFCRCVVMVLSKTELVTLGSLLQEAAINNEMENLFEDLNILRE